MLAHTLFCDVLSKLSKTTLCLLHRCISIGTYITQRKTLVFMRLMTIVPSSLLYMRVCIHLHTHVNVILKSPYMCMLYTWQHKHTYIHTYRCTAAVVSEATTHVESSVKTALNASMSVGATSCGSSTVKRSLGRSRARARESDECGGPDSKTER